MLDRYVHFSYIFAPLPIQPSNPRCFPGRRIRTLSLVRITIAVVKNHLVFAFRPVLFWMSISLSIPVSISMSLLIPASVSIAISFAPFPASFPFPFPFPVPFPSRRRRPFSTMLPRAIIQRRIIPCLPLPFIFPLHRRTCFPRVVSRNIIQLVLLTIREQKRYKILFVLKRPLLNMLFICLDMTRAVGGPRCGSGPTGFWGRIL